MLSIDQLAIAQVPNLKRVSLVVGWFGDGPEGRPLCRVRPGVERRDKAAGAA